MKEFIFIIVLLLGVSQQIPWSVEQKSAESTKEMAKALVILDTLKQSDGGGRISRNNSRVFVETSGVKRVVDMGRSVLPTLVMIMRVEHLSFDAFVRCYSAADQIITNENPSLGVYWSGGCTIRESAVGGTTFHVGGQLNERDFRKRVIEDIEIKHFKLNKTDPRKDLLPKG